MSHDNLSEKNEANADARKKFVTPNKNLDLQALKKLHDICAKLKKIPKLNSDDKNKDINKDMN